MASSRFLFLNVGHSIDHLFMLMFPAVAALAAADLSASYGDVLKLTTGSFIAFGIFSLPMGWLADRLSREFMLSVFFIGIGISMLLTGLASEKWQIFCSLILVGMFAAIYHPVGLAMVSQGGGDVGRRLGVNGVWGNMGVAASALSIGVFADFAGWREAFFIAGGLSIVLGLGWIRITRAVIAESSQNKKKTNSPSVNWQRVLLVVAITTTSGKTHTKRVDLPAGEPENPMSETEIERKFDILAGSRYSAQRIAQIKATVEAFDKLKDIAEFTKLLRA